MQTIQKLFAFTLLVLLFVGISSFDTRNREVTSQGTLVQYKDTVPGKTSIQLDKIFEKMSTALQEVKTELQKIDWKEVEQEVNKALKEVNLDKVFLEINSALNSINTKDLAAKLSIEMNEADFEKLKSDMHKAFDGIQHMDMQKLQKAGKDIRIQIDPKQKESLKRNLDKLQPEIEKKMQELKQELEQMKLQMKKSKNNNYTNLHELEFCSPNFQLLHII